MHFGTTFVERFSSFELEDGVLQHFFVKVVSTSTGPGIATKCYSYASPMLAG